METAVRLDGVQDVLLPKHESVITKTEDLHHFFGGRFRRVAFEILLASLVINIFALAAPLFVMAVYNKVIAQNALDTLNVLAIGMLTLYVFDIALRGIRGYIVSHTGARVDAILGGETMHRMLNLPYRDLESAPAGLMNERLRQLDTIREFFTGAVPVLLVDQFFVLLFLITLFILSPVLGGIALAVLPIFALLSFGLNRTQRGFFEHRFQALATRSSVYLEVLRNALTVKSLGLEPEIERRWETRVSDAAATGFHAGKRAAGVNAAGMLLQQAVALAILFFGARLVIYGELSIGALVAANLLATRAIAPVRHAVSAWNQLQETRTAFRQLALFFEKPQTDAPGNVTAAPAFEGAVRFEDTGFRYAPGLPPVLDGLAFEIPKETIFAIIGPAGSGKSTLVKLLQGLYTPSSGRILIDETDIAHLSAAALCRQVVSVPQESQLFSGTVRENLLYGLHNVPAERAVAAAKFVGAHAFIQHLPQGYDTPIGEGGRGLSGGQKQMLCVARALARNPKILILDEATNAIDPAAEKALLQKLRETAKGHTVLLLTNRLAPAAIADHIAFLVNGRIESLGPRSEMLETARRRLTELSKEPVP
ncbi:MAG: peptidase domain-containing ABC transporter [Alphaproteobacteria bacterium]|nr:peptidase domain-containing ABC transporter [Alphaproteobacteria bacterium]